MYYTEWYLVDPCGDTHRALDESGFHAVLNSLRETFGADVEIEVYAKIHFDHCVFSISERKCA